MDPTSEEKRLYRFYMLLVQWLSNNNNGKKISEFLEQNNIKRIGIYGYGDLGELLIEELLMSDIEVVYCADRDWDIIAHANVNLIPPTKMNEYGVDAVVVSVIKDFKIIRESINCTENVLSLESIVYKLRV